jgi:hypothetical protein
MLSGSVGQSGTIGTIPKIGSGKRLGRGEHPRPRLEEKMFEVSFWNDHVQRMHYADSFDNLGEAIAYAREGLEYPYNGGYLYTDATILDTEDYTMTEVTRTGVSGTF